MNFGIFYLVYFMVLRARSVLGGFMQESSRYKSFYFILYVGLSCYFALFSIYLSELRGYDESYIGILLTIPPIISIAFQPLWGIISDIFNSKKKLAIASIAMMSLSLSLIIFAKNDVLFIILFIIFSIGLCGFVPLTNSMTVSYINETYDGKENFGSIRLWGSFGFAVAAIFVTRLVEATSLNSMFILASGGFAISILFLLPIKEYKNKSRESSFVKDISALAREKEYVLLVVFLFIFLGTMLSTDQYVNLFMREKEISLSQVGVIQFLSVMAEVPVMFYCKRIVSKYGESNLMLLMILLTIARYVAMPFASTFLSFIIIQIIRGMILGFTFAMVVEYIVKIISESIRTSAIALYSTISQGIAQSFFLVVSGVIISNWSYEHLFYIYALVNLVGIPIILYLKKTLKTTQ